MAHPNFQRKSGWATLFVSDYRLIVMVRCRVSPNRDAEIVADVFTAGRVVENVKFAEVRPAGMVTVAGTCRTALFELES